MGVSWNTVVWRQFGAAINMLENALVACPLTLGLKTDSAPGWVGRAKG
jgi:hypothetical protein